MLFPAACAYEHLLASHKQTVALVVRDLRSRWGRGLSFVDVPALEVLKSRFAHATDSDDMASRWITLAAALKSGDYQQVIAVLVDINGGVMGERSGGGPWIGDER